MNVVAGAEAVADAVEAGQLAHLRYVSPDEPGLRREAAGGAFRYVDHHGAAVADEKTLARIRPSPFRRPIRMYGSAVTPTTIYRRSAAMPAAGGNTATTHAGGWCATTPNTIICYLRFPRQERHPAPYRSA